MADRSFTEDNRKSRERLKALAARLTDTDLALELADGWSVSALLAHMAFWDRRMLVLIQRWKKDGVGPSGIDSDAVNDAMQPLWRAVEPRAALLLALEAAEAVDRELDGLPDEMIEQITASGVWFRFQRAVHRNGHLDPLEAALPS